MRPLRILTRGKKHLEDLEIFLVCEACDKHLDVENITLWDFQCVFELFVNICAAYLCR